jgi:outer membrane receptor protein involved in Fe transport
MLDGIDNNNTEPDNSSGWGYAILPPIDGLAEFKIQTSDFSPEFGRAGGAVVNAVTKSGTNQFHGDLWEFVRNHKFDSADFFENASNSLKGEYRQNQFGGTLGGPLKIPGLWQGERRAFFFADYEGLRVREGFPQLTTVPTFDERGSGFQDLSDLITLQSGSTPADDLGRTFPLGTVFNPATTRPVTAGQVDPVTNMMALSTGYVRDPFQGNMLPTGQIDSNAVKLSESYPSPTAPGLFNNFFINTPESHNTNQVDARMDINVSNRNQMFLRGNWYSGTLIVPPPFQGVAQGGGVLTGNYLIQGDSLALGDTQTFSPTLVNESRLAYIRQIFNETNVSGGNTLGIPQMYGIQGIPQYPGNGGLPYITINGLNSLGPQGFIPIFKDSNIWDARDDLTKIQGPHTLKFGVDYMFNFIPYKVPPFSRGDFDFGGVYTSIPGADVGSTGIAQLLLKPLPTIVPNGIDNVGGADSILASSTTYSTFIRDYVGAYAQDDWRVSRKLTLNVGIRYEYFSPYKNRYDSESDFIPGPPGAGAALLYPKSQPPVSSAFLQILAEDGIAFTQSSNVFGTTPKDNFAPRIGFAYQLTPALVVRAGFGMFFGGWMNNGGGCFYRSL